MIQKTERVVYWLEHTSDGYTPMVKLFGDDANALLPSLKFIEALRRSVIVDTPQEYEGVMYGPNISHVSSQGDHVGNVTKQGVDVVGPDYNWKKRRI